MPSLETRIPPPLVAVAFMVLMGLSSLRLPPLTIPTTPRVALAVVIAMVAVFFSVAAAIAFRRVQTTVNPLRPQKASALVTTGVFTVTRNPMYLALALALLAWTVYLASPVLLLGPVAFIAYINRFQIVPEEKALDMLFGSSYAAYKARVRRWL